MRSRRRFLRDFEGGAHLDIFLVAAVSSLLAIRAYLELTDFPRLGGGSLHIAHMLWGGLFMMTAIVMLLSWRGRPARQAAAFLGGLGFGAFIDEIGKFITADNNYFYQPAVAVIYVVFILLYLAIRSIHRERLASRDEHLVNALAELEEVAIGDLDLEERDRALHYLQNADPHDPLVHSLRELLVKVDLVHDTHTEPLTRLRDFGLATYRRTARLRAFPTGVVTFFVAQLVIKVVYTLVTVVVVHIRAEGLLHPPLLAQRLSELSVSEWGQLVSSLLSGLLVVLGIWRIRRSRVEGFRWFLRSILVSVFLTQVFQFYRQQWAALAGLTFNILVFLALRFMIEREKARAREDAPGA